MTKIKRAMGSQFTVRKRPMGLQLRKRAKG